MFKSTFYLTLLFLNLSVCFGFWFDSSRCSLWDTYLQYKTPKTIAFGKCQTTKPVANFNPNGILGKWYLYQMYNFGSDMIDATCSTDNFVLSGNALNYTGLFIYKNGTIKAVLQNQFPISQFQTGEFKVPGFDLKVVDTDYKSYILWHACISDPSSGVDLFERIVVATRSLDEVGLFKYWFYDGLIEKKIFNNNKKVAFHVTPYGRCNCDKI